jgi:photosystem II stability/assembly factor-like uncharacterized protein
MILYRLLCFLIILLLCSASGAEDKTAAAAAGTSSGSWRLVGPKEPMQDPEGNDVGRIGAFAFHPTDPHTIFAGTPVGGLWRTQDDGANWTLLTELPKLGISDIAIDPLTPDTMYMMTGDSDSWNNHGPPSVGVLKSVDGGKTWAPTGLTFAPAQRIWGPRLVIDPTTPTLLLAATWAGLFRTSDGGNTWSEVTAGIAPKDRRLIWDFQFHPTDHSIVYAASSTQVYRSTDAGVTWTALGGGLPLAEDLCSQMSCKLFPNYSNRIRLAVTPASPDTLYVLYGSRTGFTIGLYRSDDRGNTFAKRSSTVPKSKDPDDAPPLDLTKPNILGYNDNDLASQSEYTLAMAVSPTNADVVRVGGVDAWQSRDGGATWNRMSRWNYNPGDRRYVHADIHTLVDRGDALYAGTDGGIYRSTDDGKTWTSITKMKTGVTIAQIYHVCLSEKTPDILYYGAQDNGTYRLTIDGSIFKVYGGDGFVCQVDPRNPNTVYVEYANGEIIRLNDQYGSSSTIITPVAGGYYVSGPWLTPYVLAPDNPTTIYACYADVWRNNNRGVRANWTNLTRGALGPSVECRAIAVSPSDPKTIYVAKEGEADNAHPWAVQAGDARPPFLGGGGVFRSSDGGATWQSVGTKLPLADAAVTNLAISPTDPKRVWVTFGGYKPKVRVFETRDGGVNWTDLSAGLPAEYAVNAVAAEAGPNNSVYVGTDNGVYYRDDRLNSWVPFKDGLPEVVVAMLLVDKPRNRLFAATFGRGVWVSDLHGP